MQIGISTPDDSDRGEEHDVKRRKLLEKQAGQENLEKEAITNLKGPNLAVNANESSIQRSMQNHEGGKRKRGSDLDTEHYPSSEPLSCEAEHRRKKRRDSTILDVSNTSNKKVRVALSLSASPSEGDEAFGDEKLHRDNTSRSRSLPPADKIVAPFAISKHDLENMFRHEGQKAGDPHSGLLGSSANIPEEARLGGFRIDADDGHHVQDSIPQNKMLPDPLGLPPPPSKQGTSNPPNSNRLEERKEQKNECSSLLNDKFSTRPSSACSKLISGAIEEHAELSSGVKRQPSRHDHVLALDSDKKPKDAIPKVEAMNNSAPEVNDGVSSAFPEANGAKEDAAPSVSNVIGNEQLPITADNVMPKGVKRKAAPEPQDPLLLEETSKEGGSSEKRRILLLKPTIAGDNKSTRFQRSKTCVPRKEPARETRLIRSFGGVIE